MRIYEAISDALADQGVQVGFGLLGEGNLAVVEHWHRNHGGQWYASTREDGAVLMADGFARTSGSVGFATVTHGPGLTNTTTALIEAAKAHTPLVVLAGDTDPVGRANPQGIDQPALIAATGSGLHHVRAPKTAFEDVVLAFRRARRERRPIVLNMLANYINEEVAGQPLGRSRVDLPKQRVSAEPAAIERIARAIGAAHRPVVLAGRGAVHSDAHDALVELADKIGALVGNTHLARGYFAGHEFDIGVSGGYSTSVGQKLYEGADLVLAFGASLNNWTTKVGTAYGGARVVQVDVDPAVFAEWLTPADVVVGDCQTVARQLTSALERLRFESNGYRTSAVHAEIQGYTPESEFEDEGSLEGLDLRTVMVRVNRLFPWPRTVVLDVGHYGSEACRHLRVAAPSDFVFPVNYAAVGLGLSMAIGAAVARPMGHVMAVVGDGGFAMSINELDTAIRYGLPLVVLVMNDGGFGAEYHNFKLAGWPTDLALYARPDYAAVATAMGGTGLRVSTLEQLELLPDAVATTKGPLVVDIKLRIAIMTKWFGALSGHPAPQASKSS